MCALARADVVIKGIHVERASRGTRAQRNLPMVFLKIRDATHILMIGVARRMLTRSREAKCLGSRNAKMEQVVECLIAGGPQHGLVCRQLWDPHYPAPPVMASGDGEVCITAACRHSGTDGNRFLLLHPRATGAQIVAMMKMLGTHLSMPTFRLVMDGASSAELFGD